MIHRLFGAIMSKSPPKKNGKSGAMNIYVSPETRAKLRAIAKARGLRSTSAAVEALVKDAHYDDAQSFIGSMTYLLERHGIALGEMAVNVRGADADIKVTGRVHDRLRIPPIVK